MKTGLNLNERLTIMGILPQEGSFLMLKLLRGLIDKLGVSDEEFKTFEIVQEGNHIKWNAEGNKPNEIEFGEKETDLVVEALKKLDEQKKLEQRHFSLFEKFVKTSSENETTG